VQYGIEVATWPTPSQMTRKRSETLLEMHKVICYSAAAFFLLSRMVTKKDAVPSLPRATKYIYPAFGCSSRKPLVMSYCTALRLVCVALAVWIGGVLPASSATRHIVLLFDERVELPGLAALAAEFVQTLASNSSDHIETYRETMDISRFDSDSYRTLLKDYLREKYANKKIDVAVAAFGPALEFLLKHGGAIFPGTPIVFCGIDRRELGDRSLPPHVHGVLLKREFAPTLELALGLHPGTKHIAVVAGTSEFDTRLLEQARQQFGDYESRLAFRYLTAAPLQKLLIDLASLPPQTIVLFTTLFQDGAGESFVPHNVVPLVLSFRGRAIRPRIASPCETSLMPPAE
jgi:hypothetical protein